MQAVSKLDRYYGSMFGVLCGDAGGAPYETMRSEKIRKDFAERGGLKLYDYTEPFKGVRFVEAGHPTDDAELTAAFAMSLCEKRGFDAESVYRHLRGFIHGNDGNGRKSVLTSGKAYGSGGTLRSALRAETYELSLPRFRQGLVRLGPTNGALMRNTPSALVHIHPHQIIEVARQQSCITHINADSQVACIAHALFLLFLREGNGVDGAWLFTKRVLAGLQTEEKQTKDSVLLDAYNNVMKMNVEVAPTEEEIWGTGTINNTGEVMLSLRIAVWGTLRAKDFIDGLTRVISLGGDVDTYGAIAGGLLGARFGIEGIPEEWRTTTIGGEKMAELAEQLYKIAHSI